MVAKRRHEGIDDELSVDTGTSIADASEAKKFKADNAVEDKQVQPPCDELISDAGKLDSGSVETVEPIAEQTVDTSTADNGCEYGDKRTRSIRKRKSTDQEIQTTFRAPQPTRFVLFSCLCF